MTGLDRDNSARKVVVVTHEVPEWVLSVVREAFDVLRLDPNCEACRASAAVVTSGPACLAAETIDQLPALQYICCLGSGYEGVDVPYAQKRGIIVSNSAIITAEDVADHAVAITLSLYCGIPSLDRAIREGRWPKPIRRSLRELNVGIVGLGAIGLAIARRLSPFGCEIQWTGPRAKQAPYVYCAALLELAEWANILIVAARADKRNIGLIDEAVIARLGPEGIIVNVSRGSIIHEDALIAALKTRRLGGAALDVFETEPSPAERWRDVPNAVLTPHVGGFATGVRRGIQKLIVANLHCFFEGLPLVGVVAPSPCDADDHAQ